MSTMEKSYESYLMMILGAEYVAQIVKRGTHNWNNFINPHELSKIFEQNGI